MRKRLLQLCLTLAVAFPATAQSLTHPLPQRKVPVALQRAAARVNGQQLRVSKTIEAADNQAWCGYFNPADSVSGVGIAQAATYDACIFIPGTGHAASGKTLKAIRFWVENTKTMKDFKVWASTTLPKQVGSGDADLLYQNVDKSGLVNAGPTDVQFSKGVKVGAKGVYVGISFTTTEEVTNQVYPLLEAYHYNGIIDNSFFMRANGEDVSASIPNWLDCAAYGFSPLSMLVLAEGQFPKANVSVITKQFTEQSILSGTGVKVPVGLINNAGKAVKSLTIDCYVDGKKTGSSQTLTAKGRLDYSGVTAVDSIFIPAQAQSGVNDYRFVVSKIDGQDNEAVDTMKQTVGKVVSLTTSAPRRVVFESLDYIDYGNNPLNIVTGQLLRKDHKDSVIVIHAHFRDAFDFPCWEDAANLNTLPGAMFDRGLWCRNVYWGNKTKGYGMEEYYQAAKAVPSEATITMDSLTLTKNGMLIVKTKSNFLIDRKDDAYGIVYALLDDDMTANLSNSLLSGKSTTYGPDDNLKNWFGKVKTISNWKFTDIPVQANEDVKYGKLLSDIKANQEKQQTYVFNLNGNANIKALKKLKVVAMIVNRNNWRVVNAVERPVGIPTDFPDYAVSASNYADQFTLVNKEGTIPVTVSNGGLKNVTSIAYTVDDGAEKTKSLSLTGFGSKKTFNVTVPASSTAAAAEHKVTVTKVNGKANGTSSNVGKGNVYSLTRQLPRKTLVEEYTGTWCGWCPRGTVALTELTKRMPDSCVVYAVHNRDAMEIAAFSALMPAGFPSASVNRDITCDPYYGSDGYKPFAILNDVRAENKKIVEGLITISGAELSDDKVTVTGKTLFAFNTNKANYALGFVLVGDNLSGTSSAWYQHNYFAGSESYADDKLLNPLTKKQNTYNEPYNHVAIQASNVVNGVDNTVPASLEAEKENAFSYTFDIKDNALVQHRDLLKVAVILINRTTGKVVNAADIKVGGATAIKVPYAVKERVAVAYYTIDGKRIDKPAKGLYIVRYSDGSARKVFAE